MKIIKILQNKLSKYDFNPGFVGLFTNPFFFARKGLWKYIKRFSKELNGKLLDIGCGTKPYKELFDVEEYIGLEIADPAVPLELKDADYVYDGKVFPFESKNFDSAISNEVLEHVFNPSEFLSEINRVLKIEGKLLLTVPFVWDEHEQPYDYARYTSFGIKHLLEEHGFQILKFEKSVNNISVIFQLLNDYIYKVIVKKNKLYEHFIVNSICSLFNIVGLLLTAIMPKNNDLYLDNIVLAQKVKDLNS